MATTADRRALLEALREMDETEFEHFVADLWESEGWETEVTQQSRDGGIDVEAVGAGRTSETLAIQVKRYSEGNTVSREAVERLVSATEDHRDFGRVAVITSSDFANTAYRYAYKNDLDLIDGEELVDMVVENERYDLIPKYSLEGFQTMWADQVSDEVSEVVERPSENKPARPKTELRGFFLAVCLTAVSVLVGLPLVAEPATELIGGLLLIIGMIGGPVTIALDAIHLRRYDANYRPSLLWAIASFMTMGFAGLGYAVRRASRTDLRAAFRG